MKSKLIIILLALFAAKSHAISVTISADDYAVGTEIGETSGISFSIIRWINEIQSTATPATIKRDELPSSPGEYPHNHLGGWVYMFEFLINEVYGASLEYSYPNNFLSLDFSASSPFTGLKITGEATSGSPINFLAYDKEGKLKAYGQFGAAGERNEDSTLTYSFNRDFGFELGSIKVGSTSDAAYIYEITAYVPEPSLLNIFFLGLLLIAFRRKLTLAK